MNPARCFALSVHPSLAGSRDGTRCARSCAPENARRHRAFRIEAGDMSVVKLGLCGYTIGAAQYYRRFKVLEVQQTFYDPPAPETLRRWRDGAPPDFEFTMKAWQVITHLGTSRTYRRLRSPFDDTARQEAGAFRVNRTTLAAYERTLECCAILQATAILFQCPPSFRPTGENA